MFDRGAVRQWYQYALDFKASSAANKLAVSSSMRCSLLRLAALHPEIGRKLDEMRATFTVCRHVAFGDGIADQLARAVDVLAQLEERERGARSRGVSPDIGGGVARGDEPERPSPSLGDAFAKLVEKHPRPVPPTEPQRTSTGAHAARRQRGPARDLRLLTLLLRQPRARGTSAG